MSNKKLDQRRKKFITAKEKAGGVDALVKQENERPYYVYFTNEGDILSISRDKIKQYKKIARMTIMQPDQIEILKDANLNLFMIKENPKVEGVFSIESRPLQSSFIRQEDAFLGLVEFLNDEDYEVSVTVTGEQFKVKIHSSIMRDYDGISPENATIKGSKLLKFYFTGENDPHFLVYSVIVPLADLLANKEVTKPIPEHLCQCSIYTPKVFNKYIRCTTE